MSSTRLPLQLGANSLWHGFRGSVCIAPGLILIAGSIQGRWGGAILAAGAALVLYGIYQLVMAWRTRACDVLLDAEAIQLEGGPHHGLRLSWPEIDLAKTSCKRDAGGTMTLVVGRLQGEPLTLAEAEHQAEHDSFEAVHATLRHRVSPPVDEAPANPQLWRCQGCGAALVPVDAPSIHCGFCGAANETPGPLRSKLQKQAADTANRSAIGSLVNELLTQPGARHASVVLAIYSVLSVVPWVALAWSMFYLGFDHAGKFEIGFAIVSGVLGALMLFVWARSALVKRRALQLLTTVFAAQKLGNQVVCRKCQAPLPPSEGKLLCRCAYCEAENITAVDVFSRQKESSKHKQSLEELMADRNKERRRWRLFAVGSLVAGGIAGVMALVAVIVAAEFAENMNECESGDAAACLEISSDFYLGISVAKDEAKGLEYAQKACDMGLAEGCFELSDYYEFGSGGLEVDEARAAELRAQACQMGHGPACEDQR